MPLLGSSTPQSSTPSVNNSTYLTPPAGFSNPNSNVASNIAAKTATQYSTPAKPVMSTSPTPTTPNINITPSGTVVNANTGGVMTPQGGGQQTTTYAMTPTAPVAPSGPAATFSGPMYTSPEYEAAVKRYKDSMTPTDEENQAALDLENLQTSLRTAYANTANQPIPLEFITGQQKRLQESATNLAMPLEESRAKAKAARAKDDDEELVMEFENRLGPTESELALLKMTTLMQGAELSVREEK